MSKTVENLVIVVLVLAILYMLFRNVSNSNSKTNSNGQRKVKFGNNQEIDLDVNLMEHFENKNSKKDNSSEKTEDTNSTVSGYENVLDFEKLNSFVDEYKDQGRMKKMVPLEKGNEEEINAYRKSFLDFRNYTNNTSNGFDAVDNMNLEKLKDNSKGMNISDVYDRITANNYKESNIDSVSMQHVEKVDNTVRTNEFHYDSDTVNNGAAFFNNVIGYDNEDYQHSF